MAPHALASWQLGTCAIQQVIALDFGTRYSVKSFPASNSRIPLSCCSSFLSGRVQKGSGPSFLILEHRTGFQTSRPLNNTKRQIRSAARTSVRCYSRSEKDSGVQTIERQLKVEERNSQVVGKRGVYRLDDVGRYGSNMDHAEGTHLGPTIILPSLQWGLLGLLWMVCTR